MYKSFSKPLFDFVFALLGFFLLSPLLLLAIVALSIANKGKPFFEQPPMTFKDPDTGQFFPAWVEYYQQLNLAIPEDMPGCNPGGLSRSGKLEVIFSTF